MRKLTVLLALALALPGFAGTTVFRNVNVIPMTSDKVIPRQTVVVTDGKIQSVGVMAKVPEGAKVVDGSGKYLIPGLAEMHGHIPPPQAPLGMINDVLFMYLANGITTVRGMLGHDGQLVLREKTEKGEVLSPNLYLAGPAFSGQAVKEADVAKLVAEQKQAGWDLLKVHEGLTLEQYDKMAAAAQEHEIRFGGHVPESVTVAHAIEKGQETFDHIDGYVEYVSNEKGEIDPAKLAEIVEKSKKANVWIVPTSALWEILLNVTPLDTLRKYDELKYVPSKSVDTWTKMYNDRAQQLPAAKAKQIVDNRARILRALHEGGVKILMGTDAPQQFSIPGFSLHRELVKMREAGMSPYEILKSGTVNVGEYFANEDDFGTIEPGKRADLVLLDANPLEKVENLSKIRGVMVNGHWLDRAEIDEKLADIAKRNGV
jgi:imidazolonepropionase-like amidohydrolase